MWQQVQVHRKCWLGKEHGWIWFLSKTKRAQKLHAIFGQKTALTGGLAQLDQEVWQGSVTLVSLAEIEGSLIVRRNSKVITTESDRR